MSIASYSNLLSSGVISGSGCPLKESAPCIRTPKPFHVTNKASLFYVILLFLLPFVLMNFISPPKPSLINLSLKFAFNLIPFSCDFSTALKSVHHIQHSVIWSGMLSIDSNYQTVYVLNNTHLEDGVSVLCFFNSPALSTQPQTLRSTLILLLLST